MPEKKATHTPGAIRAAEDILEALYDGPLNDGFNEARKEIVADIIDRETAAPETAAQLDRLLEQLKVIIDRCDDRGVTEISYMISVAIADAQP